MTNPHLFGIRAEHHTVASFHIAWLFFAICVLPACSSKEPAAHGSGNGGSSGSTGGSAGSSGTGSGNGGSSGMGSGQGGSGGVSVGVGGSGGTASGSGGSSGSTSGNGGADPSDAGGTSGGDGGNSGARCGEVTCGPTEACCDKCASRCIPAASGAFCPDDNDPNRVCAADAGQCSVSGGSCLEQECCAGLTCCSGMPIPDGQATCFANDCPDSDQDLKQDIIEADTDAVLQAVASLPIARWRYIHDDARELHIGPMAQDFEAAFSVGSDGRHIAKVDGDGVSLAAIQALYRRVLELERRAEALSKRNAALERRLSEDSNDDR